MNNSEILPCFLVLENGKWLKAGISFGTACRVFRKERGVISFMGIRSKTKVEISPRHVLVPIDFIYELNGKQ